MSEPSRPGLYVHVPFCLTRCPYCAFHSTTETRLVEEWLDAIESEAAAAASSWGFGSFDTLYVGGGTPSVLSDDALGRLVGVILATFDFDDDLEATIEVNPGDVGGGKARTMFGLGFNRVSVGVQSFVQRELEFLGRRHNAARAVKSVDELRDAGFTNVGLDLIQGMPGQTVGARLKSLERAVELEPAHISCYELTIEEGTPFGKMRAEGGLVPQSETEAADGFRATSAFLRRLGFVHYEVSNFASGSRRVSRHNRKYWTHIPYLGLGPAAHSFDGVRRWWNVTGIAEYAHRLACGNHARAGEEVLDERQLRLERLALGFRNDAGVDREDLPDTEESRLLLDRIMAEGLVTVANGRVTPTVDGMRVADGLAGAFSRG